jgi:hypothetical protein
MRWKWLLLAAWVVFAAIGFVIVDPRPEPVTAVAQLVVPPLLVAALWQIGSAVARRWPSWAFRSLVADAPGRLLAAAVAALPERRRDWGAAMLGELAEVRGRSARWRFALSSVRATLALTSAGGWLAPALVLAGAAAVRPVVGSAAPGLTVFAAAFTGLAGAVVVLAVARGRRPRLSGPALLVGAAVAAAIGATVWFLRQEPAAATYLSAPAAVYLALVLAGCLWVAVGPGAGGRAAHLGVAAAVVFAGWFLLVLRTDGVEPAPWLVPVLGFVLIAVPAAAFVVPAFLAARAGRSVRSGRPAAVWTMAAMMPLTLAVWLPEALRRHAVDGRTLDGELVAPVGVNLPDALVFCLGIFPVLGLLLATVGAAFGARGGQPVSEPGS